VSVAVGFSGFRHLLLIATATLATELAVFVLLVVGYFYKRKLEFRRHGQVMALAVVVHLASIFAIMIPSFVLAVLPEYILPQPLLLVSIVGLLHGVLGAVAIALGLYLVAAWGLRKDVQGCFKRKKIMQTTITIWFASLILGIILFGLFYGPMLFG
jgi:hypothetical protein